MSIRTPPTLLQLAAESLLRDQASAIAALEHLPAEVFPQLFTLAYRGRYCPFLKAITQAWPFPFLPLGGLNEPPPVRVLKAVLDGLDALLAQEFRPRRWKLRVLDLRYLGSDFWKIWCGDSTQRHSLTSPVAVHRSSPDMEHPLAPVEVFLDLDFNTRDTDELVMSVIQWAQQRKGLLHLCCKKLRSVGVPFQRVRQVLDVVQLDCIQEVELNCTWHLTALETFGLYVGRMRNLQKLFLSNIHVLSDGEDNEEDEEEEQDWEEEEEEEEEGEQDWEEVNEEEDDEEEEEEDEGEQEWEEEEEQDWEEEEDDEEEKEGEQDGEEDNEEEEEEDEGEQEWEEEQEMEEEEEQEWEEEEEEELHWEDEWEREEQEKEIAFSQFLSQMLSSQHLRELDLNSPSFLRGRLHQLLRCLQTPLETLTITRCLCLTHSDLTHLFQCPNLRQLKSLGLYCANLADFSPEPLRALLDAVAPTLQNLCLEDCAIVDSQVEAILPALSRCHQLSEVNIMENRLAMATVDKLLRHTAGLRSLEYECYPVPLECYTTEDTVNHETLALVREELTGILRQLGQPRTIHLATYYMHIDDIAFS